MGAEVDAATAALYAARAPKCDYFVSPETGSDKNEGTELDSPFKTLACACDGESCNAELQTGEVICLLAGTHEITDTVYVKGGHMREKELQLMALGETRSVVLDGLGQVSLFNALQTHVTFVGLV